MFWVAEVGSAHKGSKSLAYEFIRRYSEAGATAIKFQFGWTKEAQEKIGLEYNPVRYVDDWACDLQRWCRLHGVELSASIWSMDGLKAAEDADMVFYKIGKKMFDIDPEFAKLVEENHITHVSGKGIYVRGEYPTYPENLKMPAKFTRDVYGYSDHTHGIEACLLAVARGATYIEKHVALDKTDLVTRDTPFSATPEEYATMVSIGNGIRRLLDAS